MIEAIRNIKPGDRADNATTASPTPEPPTARLQEGLGMPVQIADSPRQRCCFRSADPTQAYEQKKMAAIFAFTCSCRGIRHEGSPSFGYNAPTYYDQLSDKDESTAMCQSKPATCALSITLERTDYFARAVIEIANYMEWHEPFMCGAWMSLTEVSFERYASTCEDHDESDSYFGWHSNRLPYYPDTVSLKTQVRPRKGGKRPYLELSDDGHPLAVHMRTGLTIKQAQEIAEASMHAIYQ